MLEEQRLHFEARLADRERLVQLSIEQIEYLRMQVGRPTMTVSSAVNGTAPFSETAMLEMRDLWLSDEEEALEAMHTAGVITDIEYSEQRARIRNRDHIIE